MKKKGTLVVSAFLAVVLWGCSNTKEVVNEDMEISNFSLGDTTTIALNDIVLCNDDLALFVQFDSLVTDSRCPKGANCIWEGDAEAAFSITHEKELEHITIHTADKFGTATSAFGYQFKLIEVMPYPGTPNYETTPPTVSISVTKSE